ncbi:CDP-glucose 4,6-dehydratase [Aquabacter sp. L1I39]|uniref:CDP-glucose 4,6-dehydratase n=1 Tax=Aquabacter sp. L1I39 TaxID=2820278 RepID=UPI001FFC57AB|nr:CDP-glucose 4,6-dehydratase [Aquabacter sp. L1I39]
MGQRQGALEGVGVMVPGFWRGRRVLVTGHTGFKGAWLAAWLARMGAEVTGYAHAPAGEPNLFALCRLETRIRSVIGDINDRPRLAQAMADARPDIVLHLAAQSLVRPSYEDPIGTFATNVTGVVTLLDVVRRTPGIASVVVVTSDKCYDNREWVWGYREADRLGGRDPYSASKGCAEIAAQSMQRSFFKPFTPQGHSARIATVRAGNVIGGGDWSADRLVPDIVRGCLGPEGVVRLRNPQSVRPWQHVLEPLGAYLILAERLATAPDGVDEAWNIGPDPGDDRPVREVAQAMAQALGAGRIDIETQPHAPHEARLLRLDCAKAKSQLGWHPRLRFADAIRLTADWYAAWHRGADMEAMTHAQIDAYAAALEAPAFG